MRTSVLPIYDSIRHRAHGLEYTRQDTSPNTRRIRDPVMWCRRRYPHSTARWRLWCFLNHDCQTHLHLFMPQHFPRPCGVAYHNIACESWQSNKQFWAMYMVREMQAYFGSHVMTSVRTKLSILTGSQVWNYSMLPPAEHLYRTSSAQFQKCEQPGWYRLQQCSLN